MNKLIKSKGLLKSLTKKSSSRKHQTMEINKSKRYSPSKKIQKQIFSTSRRNHVNFNSNIEKKKNNIFQQSLKKLDKNNKLKSSQTRKNIDMSHYLKNNIFNNNNIPNNYKNNQNNSKTINNSKNKNYNTSLQKKIGSKSYVDLFQNNIYNSNDHFNPVVGRTISNSIYEKIYDYENNLNNNSNINYDNNSNDYSSFRAEMNNIINILINYIKLIKKEYEKIIIKKVQNKDKEIKKLLNEKEFLIKENKKMKYKIFEIYYCIKNYENYKDKNKDKYSIYIKQLINENIYLRNCINKTNNINKTFFIHLENDIKNQISQKELLTQKKIEEEKNSQNMNFNNINKDNDQNYEINPFKYINNNSNLTNSKINHKRQKTQFKLGFQIKSENNYKMNEDEKHKINTNSDILSGYINLMNNNTILMSKTKNSSQKNIFNNKNNDINKKNNNDENIKEEINNLSNSSSTDSVIHISYNNEYKHHKTEQNKDNLNEVKEHTNKILLGLNYSSPDEKYCQRIEFTK